MSLQTRLGSLITAIGADIKSLNTNKVDAVQSFTGDPVNPIVKRTIGSGGGTLLTTWGDQLQIWLGTKTTVTLNEWGALRGTSPYTWGDALVRCIRTLAADGITGSNSAIEVVDRRTSPDSSTMWGVGWDGVVRVGGTHAIPTGTATVPCVLVNHGATAPAGLPDGTLIFEKP